MATSCARSHVVKASKCIIVTAADVVHVSVDGRETDCAVMQQTLAPVSLAY